MVFVVGIALLVVGVLLLLRDQKEEQKEEDFLLIDFRYRLMVYLLIGSGIVLIIRELMQLFL